jgi:GNAT superfamily N-acetyltransferase
MCVTSGISADYTVRDVTRDGRNLVIRPIRPDDKPIFEDEFKHLSPESRYYRFFSAKTELSQKELAYFSEIDLINHVGLLAFIQDGDKLIAAGTGRYIVCSSVDEPPTAELAFEVCEEYQGLGIASLLLRHLTEIARSAGIVRFVAYVLPTNRKMLDVFYHSDLKVQKKAIAGGVLTITMKLR